MTKKLCVLFVALSALCMTTAAAFAQGPPADVPGNGPPQEVVDMLTERGWRQITPEVFQRPVENNASYETMVFGADGLAWLLRVQEGQLQVLESYRTDIYNPDLEDLIAGHVALMEENARLMLEEIRGAQGGKPLRAPTGSLVGLLATLDRDAGQDKAAVTCDTSLHRDCNAFPTSTGPAANSNVTFTESCTGTAVPFSADPFCNAYADGWSGTTYTYMGQTNDPPGGYNSASCSASASVTADSSCNSYGEAQISLQDPNFGFVAHYIVKSNSACRPPTVTISGPTSVWVPAYSCTTIKTWTSTVSGGTPGYSYQWKYNNLAVGTGTSYSRTYCNSYPTTYDRTYYDTVALSVTDSEAITGSDTHSVTVTYEGNGCSDPCICPIAAAESAQDKVAPCPIY